MFESHIITRLVELWRDSEEAGTSAAAAPRPSHVQEILEKVFLAGLKREEDQPIRVSISLIERGVVENRGHSGESVSFQLAEPVPLTVDALCKLAPAFDPITTSLAVAPAPLQAGALEIWGGVFSSVRGRNRFDALCESAHVPDAFTVTTWKPGSLSVFRGRNIITRLNAGKFTLPTPTPFTASLMGWSLLKVIKGHPEFLKYGVIYWRTYRDLVDRLLVEASQRGHGGAVIWVPEGNLPDIQQWLQHNTALVSAPEGAPLAGELCETELKREDDLAGEGGSVANFRVVEETILECKRRLVEHVELLAQMVRVDGALVISDRLRPISFGSILAAPHWRKKTVLGSEDGAETAEVVRLSHYGTRHNSAVNFISQSPGCVAFVLSQDGPIAGLTLKDEETVYWWPDCLSQLWAV